MIPPKKPKNFSKILDILNTQAAAKQFSPKTYVNLVGEYSRKAYDNGELSKKEYMDIVQPLFGDAGIMATEKIKQYDQELQKYADGGRIGFLKGGDTKYNAMVFKMYAEAGGKEGTGMDIDSFAEKYFPKFATGGRVNYRGGDAARSDAASGRNAGRASPSGGADDKGSNAQNLNQQRIVAPPPKTSAYEKIKALGTVPLNFFGSLFGNPFNPTKPIQAINTKAQMDYLNYLANQKEDDTGVLSYDDYGTQFNLSDLKDPIAFSTAMTMGGTGYKKADTGDITYTGGTYDFDGAAPFIDKGGLMGLAYRGGEYLGNKFSPARLANGGRVNYNSGSMEPDTMALKEKIEEIMDIEGVGFGEAFKQAMRELKSQSKE